VENAESGRTAFRIIDWNKHFENNRTREIKSLRWVSMPNYHDGSGFRTLMQQPDGEALYGVWAVIVQIASRAPQRGLLVRNDGEPYTAETISARTGMKLELVRRCIEVLQSPQIKWIQSVPIVKSAGAAIPQEGAAIPQEGAAIPQEGAAIPQEGAAIPQEGAAIPQEGAARARAGGEGRGRSSSVSDSRTVDTYTGKQNTQQRAREADRTDPAESFPDFWRVYASIRPVGETEARQVWTQRRLDSDIDAIGACLASYLASAEVSNGKVMAAAKWLRTNHQDGWNSRWPEAPAAPSGNGLADALRERRAGR